MQCSEIKCSAVQRKAMHGVELVAAHAELMPLHGECFRHIVVAPQFAYAEYLDEGILACSWVVMLTVRGASSHNTRVVILPA